MKKTFRNAISAEPDAAERDNRKRAAVGITTGVFLGRGSHQGYKLETKDGRWVALAFFPQ